MKLFLLRPLVCLLLLSIVTVLPAFAQNPIIYSQFFANPYQFNPAAVAQSGHPEVNLFYRKQWMGIENAPEAGALNVQIPLGRNVAVGAIASSSKTILLRNTTGLATIGYVVRLGYFHHLNFGLSGGIGLNNFDMDAVAMSNDPALANLLQKNTYLINQFGITYQFRNLIVGLALPELLDTKPNSIESFQEIKFNPFHQKFGSVQYAMNVTRDIQLQPIAIFRATSPKDFQIEGMLTATWKNTFWIGGSYRDGYGITAFIGLKARNLIKVGYGYDRPLGKLSKATTGSHEIYAGSRFGKRDREEEYFLAKKTKDSLHQVAVREKEAEKKQPVVAKQEPVVKQPVVEQPKDTTTQRVVVKEPEVKQPEVVTPAAAEKEPSILDSYYVVVGAFRSHENAMKQIRELRGQSMFPDLLYILDKNFYYVFLYHNDDRKLAVDQLQKIRNKYPRAWLYDPAGAKKTNLDR
ncbi:MAG TPA: PorP/SprF family type IX secretion system membrane protein [Cyclobacteriaceae bacterium]|nr:PorP/SprF family type IX secretion system membrane protein [Cyclobacteriaceae bacterium]